MQRILIVSDTHKRLGNLYEALEKEGSVDAMIHLGDLEGDEDIVNEMIPGPVYMVPGNNDYYSQAPRELEIQIAGKMYCSRTDIIIMYRWICRPSVRKELQGGWIL
mgnify:CR=1 FL=1